MDLTAVLVASIAFVIAIRLLLGWLDGARIDRFAHRRGWELIARHWSPFGPGWAEGMGERIYLITFRDRGRSFRCAHVRTSTWGGVQLTLEDAIEDGRVELRCENERLRAHVADLMGEPRH